MWLMNLINSGHSYVNFTSSISTATYHLSGVARHTGNAFLRAKALSLAYKSTVFCNNTLLSAVIGSPLGEKQGTITKKYTRVSTTESMTNGQYIFVL